MKSIFVILYLILDISSISSQTIPEGYILQYDQKFAGVKATGDFGFSNYSWQLIKAKTNYYLQSGWHSTSDSQALSLPANRAILKDRIFGDFILEADVMPSAEANDKGEVCFFLGMKDSTRYYLIVLSTDPASDAQGIYVVKRLTRTKLPLTLSESGTINANAWQKIRIERNIVNRTIRVFAGNMQKPLMAVKNYELVMGSVGIGSFRSPLAVDNLMIWAPTMIREGEE